MAILPELLIGLVHKILLRCDLQDGEVFYDQMLDSMLDGNAHIISMRAPGSLQERNVVNPHQTDHPLAGTCELATSAANTEKLEPTLPGVEAPDAWI